MKLIKLIRQLKMIKLKDLNLRKFTVKATQVIKLQIYSRVKVIQKLHY